MDNWATILDIIEVGMLGDKERCRAYAELLRDRFATQEDGARKAEQIQHLLDGKKGLRFGIEPWCK